MKVLKKVFEAEIEGKQVKLAAMRPSYKDKHKAELAYGKAFREALESGAYLREKIDSVMREQNLWDDAKQARHDELLKLLREGERDLKAGGIRLSDARAKAIEMSRWRREWQALRAERSRLDVHTAQGKGEQARFDYLVSACVVDSVTGKSVFSSMEAYQTCEEPYAYKAAAEVANLVHDIDEGWEKELPENKFLLAHHFVNDKLQYIDKTGHLVDSEGRLVDGDGRYINEAEEFVDRDGNLLDADGGLLVTDPKPFLDDDGNALVGDADVVSIERRKD